MKKKITVSIDENILERIDSDVTEGKWKNRSSIIEGLLDFTYWEFIDSTVVIFAHDYKWDNRHYPFDIPKALLEVRKESIIKRQIKTFIKPGIKSIIISIPNGTRTIFEKELLDTFPTLNIQLLELDVSLKTGEALRNILKMPFTDKNIIISNGDIFYWDLDLKEYYDYHKNQKSDFSFCLKFVFNPEQLWNVRIHGNKIIEFVERPKASQMNLTNSWLYITTRDFLDSHNFWDYLEMDFFPNLPDVANTIWYIYSWEWEHIQNDSAYEMVNGWLM